MSTTSIRIKFTPRRRLTLLPDGPLSERPYPDTLAASDAYYRALRAANLANARKFIQPLEGTKP